MSKDHCGSGPNGKRRKLTFRKHLKVIIPHAIEGVLKHPPGK